MSALQNNENLCVSCKVVSSHQAPENIVFSSVSHSFLMAKSRLEEPDRVNLLLVLVKLLRNLRKAIVSANIIDSS